MRYIDGLKTIPPDNPDNALILGTALHTGIEKSVEEAITEYYMSYPIITDEHINEAIKLEYLIPMAQEILPPGGEFEVKIEDEHFLGYIDYLVPARGFHDSVIPNVYDIYDFKYTNNANNYKNSAQLHLYKYFFEKSNPGKFIRNMYFLMVPKVKIKQKQTEYLAQFRNRIRSELANLQPELIKIEYNPNKVIEFLITVKSLLEAKKFPKNESYLCNWCEFQEYCKEGVDFMLLPENKRREKTIDLNPDMWIYADSYVGKSTFVDQFDDLLFINTDGNTDNTTSPVITIADQVTVEGRITRRKFAWEVFLDVVAELEKKQNDFKRICLDLVEDLYEHCRLYIYDKLDIQHEQDAGYGKGWDMVRTEFLSTIKRLKNLGYQIIYISKEIIHEITLKNGTKITTFRPNINEKVANVLAGTVDLTVRAYMDGENRYLQLEKKENIFGGGRFSFKVEKIPLNKEAFLEALRDAQEGVKVKEEKPVEPVEQESTPTEEQTPESESTPEEPTRRRRRRV